MFLFFVLFCFNFISFVEQPAWEVICIQKHRWRKGVLQFKCKWDIADAQYFSAEQLNNAQVLARARLLVLGCF